jgi:hypothetical protein
MEEQIRTDREPLYRSRSTLLIPKSYFNKYFWRSPHIQIGQWQLSMYLSSLVDDPKLEYKLSFLRTGKWKKQYQEKGQELQRVNFYPDERDWGKLSAISNATGYSRCYIFVYLMLIAMGEIILKNGKNNENSGTIPSYSSRRWNDVIICTIRIDSVERKLTRKLQI